MVMVVMVIVVMVIVVMVVLVVVMVVVVVVVILVVVVVVVFVMMDVSYPHHFTTLVWTGYWAKLLTKVIVGHPLAIAGLLTLLLPMMQ